MTPTAKCVGWEPRYNLGRSRAGGWDARDGWHVVLVYEDGTYYCPGQNNGKCGEPYYDAAAAQAVCDKLNRKVPK
jgi:hypothetical protein